MSHQLSQLDVFSAEPLLGNPVAVVHDASDVTDDQMAAFARWTNLSETTFLVPATHPSADYRLRIFTPGGELPFAGHPTIGSARAWLAAGGVSKVPGRIVQECGIGLVTLRIDETSTGGRIAFNAPPLTATGRPDDATIERIASSLRISSARFVDVNLVDNGPGWIAVVLPSAGEVLGLEPDFAAMAELGIGVIGPHPAGGPADFEIRAFIPRAGVPEDPVTGSLAAGLARWLIGTGAMPRHTLLRQGTRLDRCGLIHIDADEDGSIWVGGDTVLTLSGHIHLG